MVMTMSTFILRIIYIIVTLALSSLCEECGSSMDDNEIYYYNDSVIIPLESYCFVNECTIRIKESNVLLTVINNTGDWITATNTTNMFTTFVNGSINNYCSSGAETNLNQINTALYVIRNIIYSVGIIAAIANISVHVMFKELRTASGILVIILSTSVITLFSRGAIRTTFYYYQVNTPAEVCAIFFDYLNVVNINTYEATRTTILAHFVYSMYRSYRILSKANERSLLCKYITFIVGASTVNSAIIITVDAAVYRAAFHTEDGQCIYIFDTSRREEKRLSTYIILYVVIFLIWLLVQLILITVGLVLYFLSTRRCCGSKTRDLRVSVILMATVDLNTIIFIVLVIGNIPALIGNSIQTAVVATEQVALLALFASSNKVMERSRSIRERSHV